MKTPPKRSHPHKKVVVPFSDSVGKTLRRQRLANGLTLDQIVAETRIQKPYLKAIEQGHYDELPHTVHVVGFVRRYARTLGLDSQTAAKKYLLERGPMPNLSPPVRRVKFKSPIVGSRLVVVSLVGILMIAIAGYLVWQLRVLAAPPQLSVDQPANNSLVLGTTLTVSGSTTPGANVTVNGQATYVDEGGHFQTSLSLPLGVDQITVVAANSRHQTTATTRTVLVHPKPK